MSAEAHNEGMTADSYQDPEHHQNLDEVYPATTRKSEVLFGLRVVVAIVGIEAIYVVFRVVGGSSSLGYFLLTMGLQVLAVLALWLSWRSERYTFHDDEIIHERGFIFHREQVYPYNNIQTITVMQGPGGRMLHYGHVSLYIPTLGETLEFSEIPHPHHFVHRLKHCLPYPDKARFIFQG